jgi:hypothetical protein
LRFNILAVVLSMVAAPASTQEAQQNQTITLDSATLICSTNRVYGVFKGSSFIPDPDDHGFTEGLKILSLPSINDRISHGSRGWVLWKDDATESNGFYSVSNAFNETTLEWHLNYTFFSDGNMPVSISISRLCSELREIVPDR